MSAALVALIVLVVIAALLAGLLGAVLALAWLFDEGPPWAAWGVVLLTAYGLCYLLVISQNISPHN